METVRHLSVEQTALANLIYRLAPNFYETHYEPRKLALGDGSEATVMALPMKLYNFTKIRQTDTSLGSEASVAHFCGGKKQQQHWEWVHRMIAERLDGSNAR
jgi:hypothetical protein